MRKHEEVAAAMDRQGLDPDHEMAQDATGMYPLKQAIALKHYVLTLLLPAAVIHILGFGSVYGLLRSNGLGDVTLLVAASLPGLLLSSLFLLMARRDDLRRLGRSFFTRYERGRRFVIGLVISWTASVAFLFFVSYRWNLLSLWPATILLAAGLILGNTVLVWLNYELSSYIMFGVLTWLVSVVSFSIFDLLVLSSFLARFSWSWVVSQTGSFVLAVLFAFFTNRLFVFSERGNFWVDMVLFFASRIVSTLVFEFGAMYVLINLLQQNRELSKFFGSFLVTIANYFISKYFVFRKRGKA